MDETYQSYVNRVIRLTLPAAYEGQLVNLQPSPKFVNGQPMFFPGYSVVTPPGPEDVTNLGLYEQLAKVQQQLQTILGSGFCPLPSNSFHLTIADLIWDNLFRDAIAENSNFETQLKECIQKCFNTYTPSWLESGVVEWQVLGLLVFPRALAVALVPKSEADYPPVMELRRSLYQNRDLMGLGIEQQYHFTAHLTLGYFDRIPDNLDVGKTTEQLTQLNDQWLEAEPQLFTIKQVELRYFNDMTNFERQQTDPVLSLS
ncbi:MAG: DUF1868 domain-containing protein [Microcystaceae cyanobacterium]